MVGQAIKESDVINSAFDCHYINLSLSDRLDAIGKNSICKVFRYLSMLGHVTRQLLFFRPDICYLTIQVYKIGFYKDFPMVLMAKLFRVKVVYHLHTKGVSNWQHRMIDDWLYRLVFRNVHVILLSKTLYPDIQKYVPEERVRYCANGIAEKGEGSWEQGAGSWEQGAGDKEKRTVEVLFLSNLIESKGVFVLLEACRLLKDRKIAFHCTFVGGIGDVVENQFLDKVAQMGLIEHVVYAGKRYGVEKDEVLLNSDIFVHPTYNDCFPLVLLEAMQHSLPIVSTFEGAIPEIVEDSINGFLVPQKDAKSLAEKLEILISNPELRQQMGKAGRRKYENEFTLEKFENRLKDILRSL
jgi:glycosyltransferase involved in cell wall biosynthesis